MSPLRINLLRHKNDADYPEKGTGVRTLAEKECGYTEGNRPWYLDGLHVKAARIYNRALVLNSKREDGNSACVHQLRTMEYGYKYLLLNAKLQDLLKENGITEEEFLVALYYHDIREDFREKFPEASKIYRAVDAALFDDKAVRSFVIKCVALFTDPSRSDVDKHKEPIKYIREKMRRLRLQAIVVNATPGLLGYTVSVGRSADKFATYFEELEKFKRIREHFLYYFLRGKINPKEIRRVVKNVSLRRALVMDKMDKITDHEKKGFINIEQEIVGVARELMRKRQQVLRVVNAPQRLFKETARRISEWQFCPPGFVTAKAVFNTCRKLLL